MPNESPEDIRASFFAKLLVGGGCGALGAMLLVYGFRNFPAAFGLDWVATFVFGPCFGAGLLWTAWKILGQKP